MKSDIRWITPAAYFLTLDIYSADPRTRELQAEYDHRADEVGEAERKRGVKPHGE